MLLGIGSWYGTNGCGLRKIWRSHGWSFAIESESDQCLLDSTGQVFPSTIPFLLMCGSGHCTGLWVLLRTWEVGCCHFAFLSIPYLYGSNGTGAILKISHLIDTFFNTLLWTRQWRETNNQQEEIKCYFLSEKELSRMRMLGINWLLSWFSYLSKFTHLIKFSKLMLTNYFVSTKFVVRGCQMRDEQLKI